jgi:hypothetical protein
MDNAFALRPPVALDRSAACRAAVERLRRTLAAGRSRRQVRSCTWDEGGFQSADRAYHAFVARTRGF